MRGLRYHRILAGTAVALVLAAVTAADAASSKGAVAAKPAKVTAAPVASPKEAPTPAMTATTTTADVGSTPGDISTALPAPAVTTPAAAPIPAATPASTTPAAATETAAPDPFAALDPADRPIAEKIRDLLAAKTDKIFANKKEHAAVETFYQSRNMAPLWLEKGVESERAKAAAARLRAADSDGLDLNDYKIPDLAAASSARTPWRRRSSSSPRRSFAYARATFRPASFSYAEVSKNIEAAAAAARAVRGAHQDRRRQGCR